MIFNTINELWQFCKTCPICKSERRFQLKSDGDSSIYYFNKTQSELEINIDNNIVKINCDNNTISSPIAKLAIDSICNFCDSKTLSNFIYFNPVRDIYLFMERFQIDNFKIRITTGGLYINNNLMPFNRSHLDFSNKQKLKEKLQKLMAFI